MADKDGTCTGIDFTNTPMCRPDPQGRPVACSVQFDYSRRANDLMQTPAGRYRLLLENSGLEQGPWDTSGCPEGPIDKDNPPPGCVPIPDEEIYFATYDRMNAMTDCDILQVERAEPAEANDGGFQRRYAEAVTRRVQAIGC